MVDSIRLHVSPRLVAGASVPVTPAQAHYLTVVMRRGIGDAVRIFNGLDGEWHATIAAVRKGAAELRAERCLRPQADAAGPTLAFAPLKRDATDMLVQKATELGVRTLQPVLMERSVAQRVNPDRLAAIATEAAEQCERLTLPALCPPVRLPDFLASWPAADTLAAALERTGAPLLGPGAAGLLIGPEGGFTRLELDLLRLHPFVVSVSLGPLVLRAETAAIAGLARMLGP